METATYESRAAHKTDRIKHTPEPQFQDEYQRGISAGLPLFMGGATPPPIQAKLRINRPGDRYEQDADRVAGSVMRGCACGGTCANCRSEDGAAGMIQRKERGAAPSIVEAGALVPSGGGQPLDAVTRSDFEGRFGQDFSVVRVHTGPEAARRAQSIQARAFTAGNDIVFDAGEYAPSVETGRFLLAHELAHVVQQRGGGVPDVQREVTGDIRTMNITQNFVDALTDEERIQQLRIVIDQLENNDHGTPAYITARENLRVLVADLPNQRVPAEVFDDTALDSFARDVLDSVLPVGQGYYLSGDIGVTPVIPVYFSEAGTYYVHRVDDDTIRLLYRQRGEVAFDTGVGVGLRLGRPRRLGGRYREGFRLGAEAGAQFQAGLDVVLHQEYEIPITRLDDYLIDQARATVVDFIIQTVLGMGMPGGGFSTGPEALSAGLQAAAGVFDQFETRRKIELEAFAQGDAEAAAGLRTGSQQRTEGGQPSSPRRFESEMYTRGGQARPGGRPTSRLVPRDDQTSFERGAERGAYWINQLLGLSLQLGARASLNVSFDHELVTAGEETALSRLRVSFEGEASLNLPIIRSLPVIPAAGVGAALIFDFANDVTGDTRLDGLQVEVYTTAGEFDVYEGNASQDTFKFDLGKAFSLQEVVQLLQGNPAPLSQTPVLQRLQNALSRVEVRRRYQIGGPMFGGLSRLIRRQGSTRILISDTSHWRRAAIGLNLAGYLTVAMHMEGPDFIELARQVLEAGGQGYQQVSQALASTTSPGFSDVYNAVVQYLTDFVASQEFAELERLVLDSTYVDEVSLRFEMGAGIGGQVAASEGAKVRVSGYVQAGTFCEDDLADQFEGGRITLRTFAQRVGEILEDPRIVMPDCPILEAVFSSRQSATLIPCPSCHEQIGWYEDPSVVDPFESPLLRPEYWQEPSPPGGTHDWMLEYLRPQSHESRQVLTGDPFRSPLLEVRSQAELSEEERRQLLEWISQAP